MSFFKKKEVKFNQEQFKTQMKLSILRLTQQKGKTINENEAKKREVAELLREGQEHKAEIKAMSIIMNDYRVEVYTQLIIYLNLLAARYELLLAQHSCPAELKEACCAIVYASPHLSNQNELAACRVMLLARYGKQFPNQCADEQVIHPKITSRLSARSPDQTVVNYYVSAIAREYNVTTSLIPGDIPQNLDSNLTPDDVISDVIIPCTPSRVLAPVDPSKGNAFGPGLQDGIVGRPSTFTIDLTQCNAANERVVVLVSGPEDTRIVGDVIPNGDGTFTANYVPPLAGNYAVAVYCGDKHIGNGQPWLLSVREMSSSSPSDPRMCKASGSGLTGGYAGVTSKFTIFAASSDGQQCANGGDIFSVFVSGPNDARIRGDVLDNNDGTYSVTYVPPYPGQYALAIYNGKTPIGDGAPWIFDVSTAPAELDPSKCYAEGPGLLDPSVNVQTTFTITAVGTDGSIRSMGCGDRFDVLISGPNDTRMRGDVIDNGDGTYTATYTPPFEGTYAIAIYANSTAIIGDGNPIVVEVSSSSQSFPSTLPSTICGNGEPKTKRRAFAGKCVADGEGLSEGVVDELVFFNIHAFDADGLPCETGGEEFSVFISGPGVQITGEVLDNEDGSYIVTYTPPAEGTYGIAIMLGTEPIGDGRVYNAVIKAGGEGNDKVGDEEDDLMARFAMLKTSEAESGAGAELPMNGDGEEEDDLMARFNAMKSGGGAEVPMNDGGEEDDLMARFNAMKSGNTSAEVPMNDGEEDDLMARFNAMKSGNTSTEVPMNDGEEDDLMARFNAMKTGDTPVNEVPMNDGGEDDDLMARFNAMKSGDTPVNEVPMNDDGEEDDLMARFNAMKSGDTPVSEVPMNDGGEEDDLMARFNAMKSGDTPVNEVPTNDDEEDDLMARFNAMKSGDTPANEVPMNDGGEDDDLMNRFNAMKGPGSILGGSGLFPPTLSSSIVKTAPEPKVYSFDPLPSVPLSNLFAVRKSKAVFANCNVDRCVVLDNGSGTIKCGLAGMAQPLAYLPTVIGKPLYRSIMPMIPNDTVYVGDEAKRKKGILSLEYPIEHGVVRDWDGMEKVWQHTFLNEIRIDPSAHPVILAEHVLSPHETREKSAEIMFEKFSVPAFFAASQASLALHSVGVTTGVVVDIGDGTIQTSSIVNGEVLTHAARRVEFGGRECTDLFINLLSKEGVFLGDTSSERDIARDMKEKLGYVAANYDIELKKPRNDVIAQYSMPDGDMAHIYHSRFSCAEALFRPKMVGKDTLSLPQMVATSILKAPPEARKELASNIVVIGGSSLFEGLPERLYSELNQLLPSDIMPNKLVVPENRTCTAWLGGSMIGSNVESYQCVCVTKNEYEESGSVALAFMK